MKGVGFLCFTCVVFAAGATYDTFDVRAQRNSSSVQIQSLHDRSMFASVQDSDTLIVHERVSDTIVTMFSVFINQKFYAQLYASPIIPGNCTYVIDTINKGDYKITADPKYKCLIRS